MSADAERSERLAETMIELADTLVGDFDVVSFLQMLSSRCVELFGLRSAGVMLHDARDRLSVVASSDERGRTLELMELQNREGPCLDAVRERRAVRAHGAEALRRWPTFTTEALEAGYQSFGAVPMRLREDTIGALNLFGEHDVLLADDEVRGVQALADMATISVLNQRALHEARVLAEQLQHALTSRVVLEQAKGVLAVKLGCTLDETFQVMRRHARDTNEHLSDIAARVIRGELGAEQLPRP